MNKAKEWWRRNHHGKESSEEGLIPRRRNLCDHINSIFPKGTHEISVHQIPKNLQLR